MSNNITNNRSQACLELVVHAHTEYPTIILGTVAVAVVGKHDGTHDLGVQVVVNFLGDVKIALKTVVVCLLRSKRAFLEHPDVVQVKGDGGGISRLDIAAN